MIEFLRLALWVEERRHAQAKATSAISVGVRKQVSVRHVERQVVTVAHAAIKSGPFPRSVLSTMLPEQPVVKVRSALAGRSTIAHCLALIERRYGRPLSRSLLSDSGGL